MVLVYSAIAGPSILPIISITFVNWSVASPTAKKVIPASKRRAPVILGSGKSMSCFLPLILLYDSVTIIYDVLSSNATVL